jgi:hypothetical protein
MVLKLLVLNSLRFQLHLQLVVIVTSKIIELYPFIVMPTDIVQTLNTFTNKKSTMLSIVSINT